MENFKNLAKSKIWDLCVSVDKVSEDESTTTRLRRSEIGDVGVSEVEVTDDDPSTTR